MGDKELNYAYRRKELKDVLPKYTRIRDCIDGEDKIKSKGTTYLPKPNTSDDPIESNIRFANYLLRASFYNATKSTLKGLHGQIFMREPVVELPALFEYMQTDVNGSGVGLVQLAKRASLDVLALGRGGFFVDYPYTEGVSTLAEIESGRIRPNIYFYKPESIINWQTEVVGSTRVLILVVLEESYDYTDADDSFEIKTGLMWRILRLRNGVYTSQVVKQPYAAGNKEIFNELIPTDAEGDPFEKIPFFFVGSENNDCDVDDPPLDDIATLNISHYRNSADYEDSCFFSGQPTPVITGLTEDWVTNVLKGRVVVGSRAAIMLPENCDAKFLQADPNVMPFEAMKHKEKQMVALGAKLVEQPGVVRTATEAETSFNSENSVLSSVTMNCSSAMMMALSFAARFAGIDPNLIKFELSTDFDIATMSPEKLRQVIETWQRGGIGFSEMRATLRKSGLAKMADADAESSIKSELEERLQQTQLQEPKNVN